MLGNALSTISVIFSSMVLVRLCIFMVGATVVSFGNCAIARENRGEEWVLGRSRCDCCHHKLSWWEVIPVFSCVLLGGRCRQCGKRFGFWHAMTEALGGTYYLLVLNSVRTLSGLFALLFIGTFIYYSVVILATDRKFQHFKRNRSQNTKYPCSK